MINYLNQYKTAKNLVNRGKKLESKGKTEKALKLYNSAYKKLLEANKKENIFTGVRPIPPINSKL